MKALELSRKYATAVFSLALEGWLTSLNAVNSELNRNASLVKSLQNPDRPFSQRQKELDTIIPAGSSEQVHNFLYTLLKEGDMGLLGEVVAELERMIHGGPMVHLMVRITTAIALSESEIERFRQKLMARYGENLDFSFTVDPAIIGGAVVQIGDKVIDGSVAKRLETMSSALGVRS